MEISSKKMHLLLVEDSPFQVASIRNQLSEQFEVECIDCLAKLRPILFDKKIDIILLDLHLPDSQGLQTYLDCRTQAPNIPIIILTVTSDDALAFEAIKRGAQDFLVKKEVDEKVILRAIRYSMMRHESQKEILNLSLLDELTKLNNRRGFQALVEANIRLAIRNHKNCILVYLDIDEFKQINDQFGHSVGDAVLQSMGNILRASSRDSDIIARLGGDEFVVFFLDAKEEDKTAVSIRLEKHISEYNHQGANFSTLAVSYGMSIFDYQNPKSVETLIQEADENMYNQKRLKKHGLNR